MRMKQILARRKFYVSPLVSAYRAGSSHRKNKEKGTIHPWETENDTFECKDETKPEKVRQKSNLRNVCYFEPLKRNSSDNNRWKYATHAKKFRPRRVSQFLNFLAE